MTSDFSDRCVILGSANGIPNLGDVLLLHCAMHNILRVSPGIQHFDVHSHDNLEENERLCALWEPEQYKRRRRFKWAWRPSFLVALFPNPWWGPYLPKPLIATAIFTLAFLRYLLARPFGVPTWMREMKDARFVYLYGGSHFSRSFFWGAGLPILFLAAACRLERVRLVLGPQQFGPQTWLQKLLTRLCFRLIKGRVLFRNEACAKMFGRTATLSFDEVFVSDLLTDRQDGEDRRLGAVNIRTTNFEQFVPVDYFNQAASALRQIAADQKVEWRLLEMSTNDWSGDARLADHMQVGRLPMLDFEHLAELALSSKVAISMSYHGCMIASMAGCPAIPVISGEYYRWKFADFERYSGIGVKIELHTPSHWTATVSRTLNEKWPFPDRNSLQRRHDQIISTMLSNIP